MPSNADIGVHRTHCCITHGCKYGENLTCPVAVGLVVQDHPCEYCRMDMEDNLIRVENKETVAIVPIEFDFEKAAVLLMATCYKIGDADGSGMTRHECTEIYTDTLDVLKMMAPYLSDEMCSNIATDLIGG